MEEEEKHQEHRKQSKIRALIERATNSTAPDVDHRLLKAIKMVVRYSESELRLSFETLMDLMKRDHSQVRYLAFLIIDELFMRSKLFRTLVVENLDELMSLSVGFRKSLPLPAPPSVASFLRSKAIESLEKWNVSFGVHYRHLRLGYEYLKNTLRLQFPNIQANAERIRQERRERERKSKEILLNKYESLKDIFSSIKGEILSTLDEIDGCLDILHSKQEVESNYILDDEELNEFRSLELLQLRREALDEGEKVYESSDNKVVFDALRELYKLLVTKHLVSIQEWVSVLVRVEVADNRFRDSTLKEFIDIQNRLKSVKKRCEEAGCSLLNTSKLDGEEDFWEEGNVVPIETSFSTSDNKKKHPDSSNTSHNKKKHPDSSNTPDKKKKHHDSSSTPDKKKKHPALASTSHNMSSDNLGSYATKESKSTNSDSLLHGGNESESNPARSKLLTKAPVVRWGSHLDTWGSNKVFMANQRGLDIESHWGRVDDDAVIPSDKIAELSVPAMPYEEKQIEIQPCRAPLRKGGLCQRRDMKICPFHGPIIPRDDEGRPLKPSPSEDNVNMKTDLAEQLAKQAVKNVRETDKEASKKRKIDKQALKRAKLAKIREHNDAVLRDAALASTSTSAIYGEDDEVTNREKKASLASMLKKKVTSKDRIARKLLSSRAR